MELLNHRNKEIHVEHEITKIWKLISKMKLLTCRSMEKVHVLTRKKKKIAEIQKFTKAIKNISITTQLGKTNNCIELNYAFPYTNCSFLIVSERFTIFLKFHKSLYFSFV